MLPVIFIFPLFYLVVLEIIVPLRQVSKVLSLERKNKKIVFYFVLCSLIRTFETSLEGTPIQENSKKIWFSLHLIVPLRQVSKVLSLERKNKKNCFLFCSLLAYSYLCPHEAGEGRLTGCPRCFCFHTLQSVEAIGEEINNKIIT